jgi:hypothetical protein
MRISFLLLLLTSLLTPIVWAEEESRKDLDVRVQVTGDAVVVDAIMIVAARQAETWAVMTDFDHMAEFISNLQASSVLSRNGDVLQVAQKGKASAGLLSFAFESVREIRLTPMDKVQSHGISGTLKKFDGLTQFAAEGETTRVTYHAESISSRWIPPGIGPSFIESETREQFAEMRREVLRRRTLAAK